MPIRLYLPMEKCTSWAFEHHPRYMGHGWSRFGRERRARNAHRSIARPNMSKSNFWVSNGAILDLLPEVTFSETYSPTPAKWENCQPQFEPFLSTNRIMRIQNASTATWTSYLPRPWKLHSRQQTCRLSGKYGRAKRLGPEQVKMPEVESTSCLDWGIQAIDGHLWTSIDIYHGFNPADIPGYLHMHGWISKLLRNNPKWWYLKISKDIWLRKTLIYMIMWYHKPLVNWVRTSWVPIL